MLPVGVTRIIYNGNGTTRNWDFTFPIFTTAGTDIKLYKTDINGIVTEITTNYSINVASKYVVYPTEASGFPLLATGEKLTLLRIETLSQDVDWMNKGPFNAEIVEAVADKIVAILQQHEEALARVVKYSVDQTPTAGEISAFIANMENLQDIEGAVAAAINAEVAAEAAKVAAEAAAASIPDKASQIEAEAGAIDTKYMTPLKTHQAIDALGVATNGTVNPTNLLSNGDFESWLGASSAPDGWTLSGAGATVAYKAATPNPKKNNAYANVTRSGADCDLTQNAVLAAGAAGYVQNRIYTFGAWVYATVAGRARLTINDGIGISFGTPHTGSGVWEWLTVTRTSDNAASQLIAGLYVYAGNTSVYFDGAMLVEGASAFAYADKPAEERPGTDYSAVSTIVGWSSFTTKFIYIKRIGNIVFVSFKLSGTSNSILTTFTVPYNSINSNVNFGGQLLAHVDNGTTAVTAGKVQLESNSNIVRCYTASSDVAWTASGVKTVNGSFWHESA